MAHKQVEYEFVDVDLFKHENLSPSFRAKNPLAQVPALEIDGLYLTQSIAICEYLEETRPNSSLLPTEPATRARCRELVEIINAGIQPLQNKSVLEKLNADYDDRSIEAIFGDETAWTEEDNWPQYWVRKGFAAFEARLAQTAGRYCIGDSVTLADVALSPQVTGSRSLYRIDMSAFPTIDRIYAALGERPAFANVR